MDFWQKARSFAEEAAKKSQELTMEAAKRSQEFTMEAAKRSQEFTMEAAKRSQEITIGSSKLSEIVSEASKRSKEIAAEASKRADQIKVEASKRADQIKVDVLKRADQIKSQIPAAALASLVDASSETLAAPVEPVDLEKFGITDELREFVKGITMNTFRDFPLEDDTEMSDIPAVSNVRQDLTAWQETHAKLVLSTVKEISKLRYELCPRAMKERKFWRIYFILVNSHVAPYENRYMDEVKLKLAEQVSDAIKETSTSQTTSEPDSTSKPLKKTSSTSEQDLDVFLLGDLGDSDDGPDDGDKDFDDDFDKI